MQVTTIAIAVPSFVAYCFIGGLVYELSGGDRVKGGAPIWYGMLWPLVLATAILFWAIVGPIWIGASAARRFL